MVASFLTGRKQVVSIDGCLSREGQVTSGVPQGSSLGPLLFLIHVADIDAECEHVTASSFADDTRLTLPIANTRDSEKMQSDLQKIYAWANTNNMSFNSDKFELLRYRVTSAPLGEYTTSSGVSISEVINLKDLGVILENTGGFKIHMTECIHKSSNLASWVLRVFTSREPELMITLFRAMVIPHLEFCCQLWSPHLLGDIRRLEAVQRTFTARIKGIGHLNYWNRLKHLDLFSLERRRERYTIIYMYKIISGTVPNFSDGRFAIKTYKSVRGDLLCRVPAISSGSTAKLRNMIEHSFAIRGPKLYNALPPELRNFDGTKQAFKLKLDKILRFIQDKPCLSGYQQSAHSNSITAQIAQLRADGVFL